MGDGLQRFKNSLLLKGYRKPHTSVLSRIAQDYPINLYNVCDSPDAAAELYDAVKNIPGSRTNVALIEKGITFLGYATLFPGKVWKVFHNNDCILKILKLDDEEGKEISKYNLLFGNDDEKTLSENNLIFCTVIDFDVTSKASLTTGLAVKKFKGLLMGYFGVLSEMPIIPESFILRIGLQIKKALEFIHAKGYAHMDVKDSNIFFNTSTGQCFLGDYGSCVVIGTAIESTTAGYYPISLLGLAAHAKYDFYMLAVSLCMKLEKSINPNLRRSHFIDANEMLVENYLFDYVRGLLESDLKALLLFLFQIKF